MKHLGISSKAVGNQLKQLGICCKAVGYAIDKVKGKQMMKPSPPPPLYLIPGQNGLSRLLDLFPVYTSVGGMGDMGYRWGCVAELRRSPQLSMHSHAGCVLVAPLLHTPALDGRQES